MPINPVPFGPSQQKQPGSPFGPWPAGQKQPASGALASLATGGGDDLGASATPKAFTSEPVGPIADLPGFNAPSSDQDAFANVNNPFLSGGGGGGALTLASLATDGGQKPSPRPGPLTAEGLGTTPRPLSGASALAQQTGGAGGGVSTPPPPGGGPLSGLFPNGIPTPSTPMPEFDWNSIEGWGDDDAAWQLGSSGGSGGSYGNNWNEGGVILNPLAQWMTPYFSAPPELQNSLGQGEGGGTAGSLGYGGWLDPGRLARLGEENAWVTGNTPMQWADIPQWRDRLARYILDPSNTQSVWQASGAAGELPGLPEGLNTLPGAIQDYRNQVGQWALSGLGEQAGIDPSLSWYSLMDPGSAQQQNPIFSGNELPLGVDTEGHISNPLGGITIPLWGGNGIEIGGQQSGPTQQSPFFGINIGLDGSISPAYSTGSGVGNMSLSAARMLAGLAGVPLSTPGIFNALGISNPFGSVRQFINVMDQIVMPLAEMAGVETSGGSLGRLRYLIEQGAMGGSGIEGFAPEDVANNPALYLDDPNLFTMALARLQQLGTGSPTAGYNLGNLFIPYGQTPLYGPDGSAIGLLGSTTLSGGQYNQY